MRVATRQRTGDAVSAILGKRGRAHGCSSFIAPLECRGLSAIPLGFSVMGARVLLWGGCACYSFALPLAEPACSARTGATAESAPRAVQIADRGLWWLEWRMTGSRRLSHRY